MLSILVKSGLSVSFPAFTEFIGKFTENFVVFYHPFLLNFIYLVESLRITSYPSSALGFTAFPSISPINVLQAAVPSSLALKDSEVIEGKLFSRMELS